MESWYSASLEVVLTPGRVFRQAWLGAQQPRAHKSCSVCSMEAVRNPLVTALTIHAVLQMSAGVLYPDPINTSKDRYCLVWMSSVKCLC